MKKKADATNRLSYPYYYIPVLLLTVCGILNAAYLFYSHYKNFTDISYASFCAISRAINCDTVSQSPWAIVFGLPLAAWGLMAYLGFFVLLMAVRKNTLQSRPGWSILFFISLAFSLSSLYFGYISATKIKAYCPLCLLSYAISFTLLFYSWLIHRRFASVSILKDTIHGIRFLACERAVQVLLLAVPLVVILLKLNLPHYWEFSLPLPSATIATGLTKEGHPWIGAKEPRLTIEEFSDYQCFQCAKMHFFLRNLIARYPDRIRLVHRNFPLDNEVNSIVSPEPFHVGSGKLAKLAIFAAVKGKFWKMNDILYQEVRKKNKEIYIPDLADKVGMKKEELAWATQSKEINELLRRDIWQGMKYGIIGTPGFIIEGKLYTGNIPATILKQALE